jgi:hypothetical protein
MGGKPVEVMVIVIVIVLGMQTQGEETVKTGMSAE